MKSKRPACVLIALLSALTVSLRVTAQDVHVQPHQYHHYQIADPGTFGGPQNGLQNPGFPRAGVLNNGGTLAGEADTATIDPLCMNHPPDCYASHGFIWKTGAKTDLGILPDGTNSQVNWISANGLMTGNGDIAQADPFIGIPFQVHGTFWGHDQAITDVGSLPGTYFSDTFAVNNRGEVVGVAMNTILDPNSMWGIGYQTRAFYWKNGVMQDLGTLGTGTDAEAALINERGQVAGWSYINSVSSPACLFPLTTDSFIWDKKNGMRDIGGLGGTCTIATDLNNRGQVVGLSWLPGDSIPHPFVWDLENGMTDLLGASSPDNTFGSPVINEHGVVTGVAVDPSGRWHALIWRKTGGKWKQTEIGLDYEPTSINDSEQVIGYSPSSAFLWEEGGPTVDLNTLIPPNSGIQLTEAVQINNRGEIAVEGPDANGNNHAVLLIPCDENHPGVQGCDYDLIDAETAAAQSPRTTAFPAQRMSRSSWSNWFHMPRRQPVSK